MTIEEIEALVRKYLSTGIAVVVILVAPGTDPALPGNAEVVAVEPGSSRGDVDRGDVDRSAGPGSGGPVSTTDGRSGAAGTDPDRDPEQRPGDAAGRDVPPEADTGTTEANRGSGATAAERHGWGSPVREDDFSSGLEQWNVYDGPGHAGKGTRSPSAVSVDDGLLTITGDSSGTTGGMAWGQGQEHGRWEGRVRAPVSDESYNALLLLWPDAEDFPVGGEIDFMEMTDSSRQKTDLFIHYGADNSQVSGAVEIDATEWHNWAVEWTPEAITAYVDGEEWYRTTDTGIFPPGPMHLCIQLDWFPTGGDVRESSMEVDWVRQYVLNQGSGAGG